MTLPGLFVTGTDTGVGKTRVASAIVRALVGSGRRVGVLKPVLSGSGRPDDADELIEAAGGGIPRERVSPLRYELPLAPCVAARLTGTPLLQSEVLRAVGEAIGWWADRADLLVVEGVGGLLCPLADDSTVADLALALDFPLVIVARRGLGTLNHALLTIEVARARSLRVAGIVLNGSEPATDPGAEATNPAELARRIGAIPILLDILHGEGIGGPAMGRVDWAGRALRPRFQAGSIGARPAEEVRSR